MELGTKEQQQQKTNRKPQPNKNIIFFTHVYRAVCRYEGNYGHAYVYVRNPRNFEKYLCLHGLQWGGEDIIFESENWQF